MGLFGAIRAVEPTILLQTILTKESDVLRNKYRFVIVQKCLQGALLTSATIVGVGACASEALSLIPDFCCKSLKMVIGAVPQRIKPEFLDRFYGTIPERPSLAYRIECILSQALGVVVSFLGTFFLLVIRNEWAVQQHLNLRNLSVNAVRPLPRAPTGPTSKAPTGKTSTSPIGDPKSAKSATANPAKPTSPTISKTPPNPQIPSSSSTASPAQSRSTVIPQTAPPPLSTAVPQKAPSPSSAIPQTAPQPLSSAVPQKAPSPSSTAIPPPPPPPKVSTKNMPAGAALIDLKTEIVSIKEEGLKRKKAPVREKQNLNTWGKAMARRSVAMGRPTSQAIQMNVAKGICTISAQKITLKELMDEAGIEFTDPEGKALAEEELKQTLADFIFAKYGETPEEGSSFDFEGFNLKIKKVDSSGVAKVECKYTE